MKTDSRRPGSGGWQLARFLLLIAFVSLISFVSLRAETSRAVPPAPLIVTEVNPDTSTVPQPPNGDSAGRVNGMAVSPDDPNVAYAATEWGGIYRTTNGGGLWTRLNGHRPNATWDVAVDPRASCADGQDNGGDGDIDLLDADCVSADANEDGGVSRIVYATSFFDGRVDDATHDSDAGINVSYDGGATWVHPNVPAPAATCAGAPAFPGDAAGWDEPSAFGISIREDVARKVFVGTKCGVAVSLDSGATWTHVDPFPAAPGGRVWDVVVHGSGYIDVCGDEGHFRSLDDGQTWVARDHASANFLPIVASVGVCSIAASPLDPDVIFVTVSGSPGGGLFQSNDGGTNWQRVAAPIFTRIPFVVTNVTDNQPESGDGCNETDKTDPTPTTDPSPPLDDDGDGIINDGCPAVGTLKEDAAQCGNNLDDDGDNEQDDGCGGAGDPPQSGDNAPEVTNTCSNKTDDDDLDGKINDGCPIQSLPEAGQACTAATVGFGDGTDDDGDGIIDDGCGALGTGPNPAADAGEAACNDDADNDHDGFVNDGCAAINNFAVFSGENSEGLNDADGDGTQDLNQCDDNKDSDADGSNITGNISDGCLRRSFELYVSDGVFLHRVACANVLAGQVLCAESGTQCGADANDNDADGTVNDGCPALNLPESGPQCTDNVDANEDGGADAINDGCTLLGTGVRFDAGAHADPGDLEFNPVSPVPQCALFYSNDGGVYKSNACADGAESGGQCSNSVDDDDDNNDGTVGGDNDLNNDGLVDAAADAINDGCPAAGPPEVACDDAVNDDAGAGDALVNDGCLWNRSMQGIHAMWLWGMDGASQCENASDDDSDTKVNDGCRQIGAASETGADCDDSADDDAGDDGSTPTVNDGCPTVGSAESIDVYMGNQDTGVWFSRDGGANWGNPACCDAFDMVSDPAQVVYTFCCLSLQPPAPGIPASDLRRAPSSNPATPATMAIPQSGWIVAFEQQDGIDTFGANSYVMVTSTCSRAPREACGGRGNGGVFVTTNNGGPLTETGGGAGSCQDLADNNGDGTADFGLDFSNPRDGDFLDVGDFASDPSCSSGWTQIGAATTPPSACGVQAAMSGATPTFYVQTHECSGAVDNDRDGQLNEDPTGGGDDDGDGQTDEDNGAQLWKYTGTAPGGAWSRVDQDAVGTDLTSVGVFGVHPKDPSRLYVADVTATGYEIRASTDGGSNWSDDNTLEGLLGDNIFVEKRPDSGPLDFTTHGAYAQPSLLEFSPHFSGAENVILAGGRDSGVYISKDNGGSWQKVAIIARCGEVPAVDHDGDGTADDGCPGGPAPDGARERDEDIPRPWHAYFDSSGIFYIGTEGRGVWKVTGLGPSAVSVTPDQTACVVDGFDSIISSLTRLAPDGQSAGAHLSDLNDVLRLLNVSLAGNNGLNLGNVLNQLNPGAASSLQDFVDKLEKHFSDGGVSGNINGVDVLIDAGFDIVGGESVKLSVDLTLSKTVDAPLNLAAGGDTLGLSVNGTAPLLLTLNASFTFGFDAPNFNPADPTSCDSTFFIEAASLAFSAKTEVDGLVVEGNLGFFKLTTDDNFDTPGEPEEGADIDANASVKVSLLDPNSTCNDGIDNAASPDGLIDTADGDCHTDSNAGDASTYDKTRAEDGITNKITTQEMKDTSIDELVIIKPKGEVHATFPIRTNLFDVTAPESGADCSDTEDDDRDQLLNDGCPADGPAETACSDTADDDGDGKANDGCPRSNPRVKFDYSLNPGNPSLEFFDMGAVNPFGNLTAGSFLTALRGLLDWLQSLQNTGALDTQVPFMDASIGDVVAVANRLVTALESMVDPATGNPEFADAEDFQARFRAALALALGVPESEIPPIPLEYNELARTLTYSLKASDSFSTGAGEGRTPTCADGFNNDPSQDSVADGDDPDCIVDDNPNDALPGKHDRTAFEDGNCDDNVNSDGGEDALVDENDPHCHMDNDLDKPFLPERVERNTCADGQDNDADGAIDGEEPGIDNGVDAQCKAPLNLAGELDLFNGVKITSSGTPEFSAGFDLDLTFGLDLRDFPAVPTEGAGAAEDSCRDNTDNDSDSQIDALDADCGKREAGGALGSCSDGVDNNNDGVKDAQALECTLTEGGSSCYDGADNDNDLLKDLADGECLLALEDRLFIKTDGPNPELALDLSLDADNVTAKALIGILEVNATVNVAIGASEDPTAPSCNDNVDNGGGDGIDEADSDCHTDDNAGNSASYSPNLAEDGAVNADCTDGADNDDDGLEVLNGFIDVDEDGITDNDTGTGDTGDDGTVLGFTVFDGAVDVNNDGGINDEDDGLFAGFHVIDGLVDIDGDGDDDGDSGDDGSLLADGSDPQCNVLSIDLSDTDGRITLPELLQSINNLTSLVSADINAFVDGSVAVSAQLGGATIGPGTITASGGVTGSISVNGNEDGAGADTCTDNVDNGGGDEDGDGQPDVDGEDADCSPLVANLKIDTSELGDLLDFNTDDPLALLIRLLEMIDGIADQMKEQENGILGQPIPLVGVSLVDILSHAGELAEMLKGMRQEPEGNIACVGDDDDDGDSTPNDGCPGVPAVGPPETDVPCASGDFDDDDHDGVANDGCPAKGKAESGGQCGNDVDNDADGIADDGCGGAGDPATDSVPEAACDDATDEDGDNFFNDGCPTANPTLQRIEGQIEGLLGVNPETGGACAGSADDDGDSLPNDGCPTVGATAESDAQCEDAVDANEDGGADGVNDGCPDNLEIEYIGGKDLIFHLKFGKSASTAAALNFDLSDLGVDPDLIGLETTGDLQASIGGRLDLDFGVEINGASLTNPGDIKVFLLDTSEMNLTGSVDANDFQVKGNIGPLTALAGNRTEVVAGGPDECAGNADEDADGFVNEGCPQIGATAESGSLCTDNTDANEDGAADGVNDGCPADPASAHLKGGFSLTVAENGGSPGDGTKIYLSDLGSADFDPSFSGDTNSACSPSTNGACATLPIYLGTNKVCTITITIDNVTIDPLPNPVVDDGVSNCDFASAIANAALDMLLLESGLGDLLAMLEDLLNGKLFGFQLPLLGNLGLGTSFVEALETSLVGSITDGTDPATEFKTAIGSALVTKVEEFRNAVADALIAEGLLLDRDGDGTPEQEDIRIRVICDTSGPAPEVCGFGPETDCADNEDDDHDDFVNDGCPTVPAAAGTAESGSQCDNAVDDDDDNADTTSNGANDLINDGCAAVGAAETDDQCGNNTDDDVADDEAVNGAGNGKVNDGCPAGFESTAETEGASQCDDNTDDDDNYSPTSAVEKDGVINDGCPVKEPEAADVEEIRFFASIGQTAGTNPNIGFDLGLPGLGLQSTGAINLGFSWEVNIGFGVSKDHGFFLLTDPMEDGLTTATCTDGLDNDSGDDDDGGGALSDASDPDCEANELVIGGNVDLGGAAIGATIAFLQVTATDAHSGNDASAGFTINVTDPGTNSNDGRLEFSEIVNTPSFDDLVTFDMSATVDLLIQLTTTVDLDGNPTTVDAAVPQLLADLDLDWRWSLLGSTDPDAVGDNAASSNCASETPAPGDNCFGVDLNNLRLNVGTFITNMVGPIAKEIQKYTEPLQPVIDTLTAPIPVLSDLAGTPITLLDLVILLGEGDLDFLDDLAAIISFINNFDFDAGGSLIIPLGTPDGPSGPSEGGDYVMNAPELVEPLGQATEAFKPGPTHPETRSDLNNKVDEVEASSGPLSGLKQLTEEAGVSFPFLEKPSDLVQMLFGKDVTLVLWEPPNLRAYFAYTQSFGPIWPVPPVFVHIGGSVTLTGHFALGIDTAAIRAAAGGASVGDVILQGLFLGDFDKSGQEVPEFSMRGELFAGANVSVLIFTAGAEGGVFLTINIDLNDPNNDGKMRFAEIADIIEITGNPFCIFVLSGEFGAFLRVFVEVDLFFWSQRWTFTLAEITLLSFNVECDLDPHPVLASVSGSTLVLHIGTAADQRDAFENVIDEEFVVKKNLATGNIDVTAFGFTQGFCCIDTITLIQGNAADGKDKIAVVPATTLSEDGIFTCDDGVDNSDIDNDGQANGNGDDPTDDGGTDETDSDCHTDGDETNSASYDATLAEDGIDACSDGVDNGNDGKADKGTKAGDADPSLPPDEDCLGQDEEFDIATDFDGGSGDDELVGSIVADKLKGGSEKDVIQGNAGDDDIYGGDGDDELAAGEGSDDVYGDNGNDGTLTWDSCAADAPEGGGDGSDYIDGGVGADRACGQGGNDNMVGGLTETEAGKLDLADDFRAGSGNDTIDGGDGDDQLFGHTGNDNIGGGAGNDSIHGGNETRTDFATDLGDALLGGLGTDHIFGDDGDDNIVGGANGDPELRGGNHDDVILGDDGEIARGGDDLFRYNDSVTQTPGTTEAPEGNDDIEGGLGSDWLFGQGGADDLRGEGGETEDGGAAGTCDDGVDNGDADDADSSDADDCDGGDDDLIGGADADTLSGGPGIDIMLGDSGFVDHNNSAARSDDSGVFGAATGDAGDTMHGNADDDHMFGQGGTDVMNGGGGVDIMHGNGGTDTMNGNPGDDQMFGDGDADTMRGNDNNDIMRGGSANDRMIGDNIASPLASGADRMFGETGIDIMVGDNGNIASVGTDVDLLGLNPTGGDDYMEGNTSNDDMYGGPGRDEMHGNEGDDYMEGNNDSDVMTGDANEDDMIGGTSLEAKDEAGSPSGGGVTDEGDLMTGGEAVDFMAGDNASILRPGGDNDRNTYNNAVIRTVVLYDVAEAGQPAVADNLSGGDTMSGGDADDVMYGGGNGGQGVDDDADGEIDEDVVDFVDTDEDGNEDGTFAGPGLGNCNDGSNNDAAGDKDSRDPDCKPFLDEDAGGDVMHGNAGDDYLEGNAGGDTIFGDGDQDDIIGGTGRTDTSDPSTAADGRLDGGDALYGGDSLGGVADNDYDVIAGDNATIDRPLDQDGNWQVNTFNAAVIRALVFYDVGMAGSPAAAGTSGDDVQRGENNDDLIYGQGGADNQQGNNGDDYMEGNAGADDMQGNDGNDDMAGGTGRISQFFAGPPGPGVVADPPEGRDGRLDSGETGMSGGNGFDFMIGDNGVITRFLDTDGSWLPNTFHVCDPLSSCNGIQHNPVVLRDVQLLGVSVGAGTSGGEQNMVGDAQDDIMYGQGGGDDMHGGTGEDYMEGNHDGDQMYGDSGEDDMLGGGSDDSDIPNTAEPDLRDGDDIMRGESDFSDGTAEGDAPDAMIGDNGMIVRPLGPAGEWQTVPANGARLRVITLFDVEMAGTPLSLSLSGDDDMYGNDNDDTMYGQGGEDDMFGGAGDDYMEGNAHSDLMYGGTEQDDMIGGTARTKSDDPSTFVAGRTDVSTKTRSVPLGRDTANVPLGDTMYGGDGADEMAGDNTQITRPLDGSSLWTVLTYQTQADSIGDVAPRHAAGASSSRIDRATLTVDTTPGATAGSDLMFGENGDDNMFGQFDDTTVAVGIVGLTSEESHECANGLDEDSDGTADDGCSPNIGDEMYGGVGEDAMAGDQGTFDDRVLPPGSAEDIAPNQPFIDDNIYVDNTLFREFKLGQISGFGKDGLNDKGGYDRMKGGDGGDWMHGGAGNDLMNGDRGNDRLFGDNGDDTMFGGADHDHLWGGFNHDHMDVHPIVTEPDSLTCTKPVAPINSATHDPLENYTFGFADGDTLCDGNLEDVDFMYGGWNQDTMQANVGDNGPQIGDRLLDWVGAHNLYILCPGTYGEFVSTREFSPTLTTFLHRLAEGDGAYKPGPTDPDPSGYNEIAFVYKPDLKSNANPPHEDTPAHFNCSADTTTIP